VTIILNVQERRGKDIVFLKMMKILIKGQKGHANLMMILNTITSITQHNVYEQRRQRIKMVHVRNPLIKVNKIWMVSFLINVYYVQCNLFAKRLRLRLNALNFQLSKCIVNVIYVLNWPHTASYCMCVKLYCIYTFYPRVQHKRKSIN